MLVMCSILCLTQAFHTDNCSLGGYRKILYPELEAKLWTELTSKGGVIASPTSRVITKLTKPIQNPKQNAMFGGDESKHSILFVVSDGFR